MISLSDEIETRLTCAARRLVAQHGLARLNLRDTARAASLSTFSVTRNLGNKAGLLSATLAHALRDDEQFHRQFFADLAGLEPDPMHLVDIVAGYLDQRRAMPETSRVLLEIFLGAGADPGMLVMLKNWHGMRKNAWQRFLIEAGVDVQLSKLWMDMLLIEEFFSQAFGKKLEYALLLKEALRALFAREREIIQRPDAASTQVLQWLNRPEPALYHPEITAGVKRKLLDVAADTLIDEGFVALTNGRVSRQAGVSTSMISYHFGSMQNFVKGSIVHALRRDVPQQAFLHGATTGSAQHSEPSQGLGQWVSMLTQAVQRGQSAQGSGGEGFYVNYARVVAHACLLAQSQPELVDLLLWLRAREGTGTYRSHGLRTSELCMSRLGASHFAVWIKGYSLLNDRLRLSEDNDHSESLIEAAKCFALAT